MPDNNGDHKLTFKAELDLAVNKAQSAFTAFTQSVNRQLNSQTKSMNGPINKARELNSAYNDLFKSFRKDTKDLKKDLQVGPVIESFRRAFSQLKNDLHPGPVIESFRRAFHQMIPAVAQELKSLAAKHKEIGTDMGSAVQTATKQGSKSIDSLQRKIASINEELYKLKSYKNQIEYYKDEYGFKELGNKPIGKEWEITVSKIQELEGELQQYYDELSSIYGLANNMDNERQRKIAEAQNELAKLIARQKELEKAGTTWGTPEYDANYIKIRQLKKDIEDYRKSLTDADDAQQKMSSSAESVSFNNLMAKFKSLVSLLSQLKNQAIHAASALVSLTTKMWGFASALRSPKEFINKVLPRMPGLFNHTSRSIKSTHIPLKRMVNLFVKYVFGIRSIFFLYRRIRKSVGEGLQSLAIVDSTTNQSISNFLTALNTLKGSLASAFSPIINVIAPILTKFINLLATATNYVGMFLAYLTGRKTYYKAIGIQQDYAGALNDTADAAGNASDAMQDYLSGLDEIRKFDDGTGSGSGGGGGGGAGADIMKGINWEEVEIPSKIKNIVDTLKDYVKDQDWEGLGEYMASGINKGFEKLYKVISWDNIGPKITPVIDGITRTFNSLIDNINWNLIGRTVGAGVNTLVNTANRLLTGINWKNLGASFAEGINGLVDEVDWGNVGELLANKIMALWDTFNGFVHELHWDAIGVAIGDAINGFFRKYNFTTITDTIATFLNGLFITLKNATLTIHWEDVVKNITDGINHFIQTFNWKENGQILNDFLQKLADALVQFSTQTDWEGLGEGIADFLAGVEWGSLLKKVVSAIATAVSGLLKGLASEPEGVAIITAIAGWFTATTVLPIANAIATAFGAPTITKIIGGAIAKAMGGGAAGAAAGGAAGAGGAGAGGAGAGAAGAAGILGPILGIAGGAAAIAGTLKLFQWDTNQSTKETRQMADDAEELLDKYDEYKKAVQSAQTAEEKQAVRQQYSTGAMEDKAVATEQLAAAEEKLAEKEKYLNDLLTYGYNTSGNELNYARKDVENAKKAVKDLKSTINTTDKLLQQDTDRQYLIDVDIKKGELLKKHGSAEQFVKDLDTNSLIDEKIELKKTGKFAQTKTAEGFVKANSGGTYGAPMDLLKSGEFAKTKTAAGFVAAYAGGTYKAPTDLKKAGQFAEKGTVAGFVSTYAGGTVNKGIDTIKAGNLAKYGTVGNLVNSLYSGPGAFKDVYLQRYGWTTVSGYVNNYMGGGVTTPVYLALQNAWSVATSFAQTVRTAFGNMFGIRLASGGILPFATGGIIKSTGNILSMIPHYASGTNRAHGSLFVAGEAGPEIIGHINGQTEILNKSQIATAIYAAVTNGIASVLERFGTALFSQMNLNTNAVIGALRYSGFSSMQIPAIASGTVVPRNSQFLASFGATSESGNISESALRQIIREENSNNSYQFVAQLNRKTIFSEVIKEAKLQQLQSGKNPFELA